MNKRLREIFQKNAEFEKESPYNFCDRWCEQCVHEKQIRCSLYKDDLERKITCIAHGRPEDDPEITKAVMEAQYKEIDEKSGEKSGTFGIDLDSPDIGEYDLSEDNAVDFDDLPADIQKHIRFVENNPLDMTAKNYSDRSHYFLKETFYKEQNISPRIKHDFEIISWHHTLLPAKLHRALCAFHEPTFEGDISLYDAVAQLQICKKSITQSVKALYRIRGEYAIFQARIQIMIALLHNIYSRIEKMEESIS